MDGILAAETLQVKEEIIRYCKGVPITEDGTLDKGVSPYIRDGLIRRAILKIGLVKLTCN
jgi:hypothetical protein